jgi:hydroxymethylbilane synthase
MHLKIATRKSALALWQAEHVADILRSLDGVESVELLPLSTRGDEILDRSLQKIGGKGLFIKELEVAMQEGRADLAVHSMKDVPAEMPDGFCLAALLERSNHADALVTRDGSKLDDLREGAVIGSSSLRRQAQLLMMRPDIEVRPLRGNVNTRLAKLEAGDYDAIVLAATGLERLQLDHHISQQFSVDQMLPATAQGVLGIECLEARDDIRELLRQINDEVAACTTMAERAVARVLQANCQSPVASYATCDGHTLTATALVALPDGSRFVRECASGKASDAEAVGERVAGQLVAGGARELLEQAESMHG